MTLPMIHLANARRAMLSRLSQVSARGVAAICASDCCLGTLAALKCIEFQPPRRVSRILNFLITSSRAPSAGKGGFQGGDV